MPSKNPLYVDKIVISADGSMQSANGQTLYAQTQALTAAANDGVTSVIKPGVTGVTVTGVATNANDWIVLPSLSSVPDGHMIRIACVAGSNFELRTPAGSAEEINSEDCDGTKEYLCTNTDLVVIYKMNNTQGWLGMSLTSLGAVRTAVVPD